MDSRTILLIHASGMSPAQWRPMLQTLERHYGEVLCPGLTGYASVPLPAADESVIEADLNQILEVLHRLKSPCHLAGHSYGGYLALQVARRNPESISRLSLLEPVAFGVLHEARHEEGLADVNMWPRTPGFFDPESGGSPSWLKSFVEYWSGPGSYERMPPPSRVWMELHGKKIFREVVECCADTFSIADYAALTMPVEILAGEKTTRASRGVSTLLASRIPGATLTWIPGAGHMFPISHPRRVIDVLTRDREA